MKNQRKTNLYESTKSQFITSILCTMLLTPLLFLGEGLGVRCSAQVANGTGAGNCLSYNGSSNYVEIANEANFDALFDGAHPFTVSWWEFKDNTNFSMIVTKREVGVQMLAPAYWYNAALGFGLNSADGGGPPAQLSGYWPNTALVNQWVNYAITYDGSFTMSGVNGYRNGVWLGPMGNGQQTLSSPIQNNGTVQIANDYGGIRFSGQIDEVRIYNRTLTETEIRATMCKKLTGNENGLMGYWRFDEGSGSTVYDASPNGNNGTLH